MSIIPRSDPFFKSKAGEPKHWEKITKVFGLSIYRHDAREQPMYLQRSIIVTSKYEESLNQELTALVARINELDDENEYFFSLLPANRFFDTNIGTVPYDSHIVSFVTPLEIAKRSPKTNEVYHDLKMQFCPHSGRTLKYFVTTPLLEDHD